MKKSTTIKTCVMLIMIVAVVGSFAYMSGKSKDRMAESVSTAAQTVLSRDLQNQYPPTVREVVKYFTDIQKCFYNEECTEEEIEQLGRKARELYDEELLANNEEEYYLIRLKTEIASYKSEGRRITSAAVASSINVDTFTEDGSEFARIHCTYGMLEKGKANYSTTVYLLRRDENRRWKIYGWDLAENVGTSDE